MATDGRRGVGGGEVPDAVPADLNEYPSVDEMYRERSHRVRELSHRDIYGDSLCDMTLEVLDHRIEGACNP